MQPELALDYEELRRLLFAAMERASTITDKHNSHQARVWRDHLSALHTDVLITINGKAH